MSKRRWLFGFLGLVVLAMLLACATSYNLTQDGLLLVTSQGAGLIQTYSFTLSNGHISAITNSPTDTAFDVCVLNALPASIVTDPKGQYAYAIFQANTTNCGPNSVGGIRAFKINVDGSATGVGNPIPDTNAVALSMDPTGKFLYAAEGGAGLVNVYALGSGGTMTAVPGTFNFVNGTGFRVPDIVAVAPTPTVFPNVGINGQINSKCQLPFNTPPTSEFLYAVDTNNYGVWEFSVDPSTGALGNPPGQTSPVFFASDPVPLGVAVDPCDRFVYVSDSLTNKVSAYLLCSTVQAPTPPGGTTPCPFADGRLVPVPGSPFSLSGSANGPGPILVDTFGNNLYVLNTLSNNISGFKISQITGAITALTPATTATGLQPMSMVMRADGNWLFVANYNAATVSQYSVSPVTGALTVEPPVITDNYPFGVAVR